MKRERDLNMDLMRFVCMFMVISLHYFGEGGGTASPDASSFNVLFGSLIVVFCRGAVNCFFMNTGYFLPALKEQKINLRNSFTGVKKLYVQVWCYSFFVFSIAILMGLSQFSISGFLRAIFPCLGNQYWFITVYLLIALLKPFLAKLGESLSNQELKIGLAILFAFDVIQAVYGVNVFNEQGNGFLHAVTMVAFGYSLRRGVVRSINKWQAILLYFIACIALRGSGIIINRIPMSPISYWENMMVYNSPLVVLIAYAVFCFFSDVKVKTTIFSKFSGSVLAAYLIQDHSTMRENFWRDIVHCDSFYSSTLMPLHYLVSVALILVGGICIDYFSKRILIVLHIIYLRRRCENEK
ncbi:MAG: acyltransferase [Eubacteriales bacterium]|nr:acyltransferase [Eubacteriales bacterium]